MSRTCITLLVLCLSTRTMAQSATDAGQELLAVDAGTIESDASLRAQLARALELLERHEAELARLRQSPPTPAPALTVPTAPTVPTAANVPATPRAEPWYERLKIRGYTQIRYNFPGAVYNERAINEQGDRSLGGNGGFLIRRARVILYGDVHPRVSVYFQPDFASVIGEQLGVAILRDWYADIFLDDKKEFRLRVGQSKVPFGFENMQSSQNRLPLDRNDALNSAVKDERDLGVFFYWAPEHIRARFKYLVESGLKGSGDYGVFAFGAYNGQTANKLELNKFPHVVARLTWPFAFGNQFFEVGGGGYFGQATVGVGSLPDGTRVVSTSDKNTFTDARAHVSAVLYPRPFGFLFEYNVGAGPMLGADRPYLLNTHWLHGGFLTLMLKLDDVLGSQAIIPYIRGTLYEGGKKFVANSPAYTVREVEAGVEWQFNRSLELVVAYLATQRTNDKTYALEYGHWVRTQVQINF